MRMRLEFSCTTVSLDQGFEFDGRLLHSRAEHARCNGFGCHCSNTGWTRQSSNCEDFPSLTFVQFFWHFNNIIAARVERSASLQLVEKVEIGESILPLNSFSQITHGLLLFISTVMCSILHCIQKYVSIRAIYPNNLYCHMVHTWDCVFKSDVCLLPHHLIGRGNVRTRRVCTRVFLKNTFSTEN